MLASVKRFLADRIAPDAVLLDDYAPLEADAIALLENLPHKGARLLKKVIQSAAANALYTNKNLDEELLGLMARSGLYELMLSIESGNQEVLRRLIRKPTRLDQVRRMVTAARSLGIRVHGLFVIGLPGETPAQIEDTFRFARGLKLHGATFSVACPLPGSELEEICRRDDLLPPGFSHDDLDFFSLALPHQHLAAVGVLRDHPHGAPVAALLQRIFQMIGDEMAFRLSDFRVGSFFIGLLLGNFIGFENLNTDIQQLIFRDFLLGFHYGSGPDFFGTICGTSTEHKEYGADDQKTMAKRKFHFSAI